MGKAILPQWLILRIPTSDVTLVSRFTDLGTCVMLKRLMAPRRKQVRHETPDSFFTPFIIASVFHGV